MKDRPRENSLEEGLHTDLIDTKKFRYPINISFLLLQDENKLRNCEKDLSCLYLTRVSARKVVNAHGTLSTSKCMKCGGKTDSENLREEVLKGSFLLYFFLLLYKIVQISDFFYKY